MSNITLDTIRSLDANKTYYIANSTGQIKEAGGSQKFKTFFGIGDGRDKVQRLIDGVKVALLKASGESDNAALTTAIEEYDDNHNWLFSASGGSLANIANRFAMDNADKIASATARELAEKHITALVKETVRPCLRREEWPADAVAYLERAAKPLVDHPPKKEEAGGRRVLDEDAFETQLKALLDAASTDLIHIAGCERLGMPRFDKAYLDHVFATFYDENGVRNEKTEADLRPAIDVRLEAAFMRARFKDDAEKEALTGLGRDALEACSKDADALDGVVAGLKNKSVLVNNAGKMRNREGVLTRVGNYRENFAELRKAAKGNKAVLRTGLMALRATHGKPMPSGAVADIARIARSVDMSLVGKLGPRSSGPELHRAFRQFYNAIQRVLSEARLTSKMDGQDDLLQCRLLICAFLLERFPQESLRNIEAALETPQTARLQQLYFDITIEQYEPEGWERPWPDAKKLIKAQTSSLQHYTSSVKKAVDTMLGLEGHAIDSAKAEQFSARDIDADEIFADLEENSRQIGKATRKRFLENIIVKGGGPAAENLREVVSSHVPEIPFMPENHMADRFTKAAGPLVTLAALVDAKKIDKGLVKDTGFAKAIADGNLEVEFENGGKLSADPDEALDQLARAITDRKDATFTTLDPLARRKVALVAGLLGDKAADALFQGIGNALDAEGAASAFTLAGSPSGTKRQIYVKASDGNFLKVSITAERTGSIAHMGSKSFTLKPGSVAKANFVMEIDVDNMKWLDRSFDLDAFDGTEAEEIAFGAGRITNRGPRVKELIPQSLEKIKNNVIAGASFILN